MTVSTTPPIKTYGYTGPGKYDFTFLTYSATDIHVSYRDTTGQSVELVQDVDYTVNLIPEQTNPGGSVNTTYIATGGTLVVQRLLEYEQDVDWVNNDAFNATTVEQSFDEVVMMIQQLAVEVSAGSATTTWRGDWLTSTTYYLKDMVVGPDNNWYYCVIEHVSDDFETDLASGNWLLALDVQRLELLVQEAAQSEANARASAEAAESSADAAALSEANASDSEDNASFSELNAANCAGEAYQSAQLAEQYRDEAAAIIAAGKVVEVVDENYFTATAGQTTFNINPPTPQRFIMVFMNSRKLRLGEDFTTDVPSLASNIILTQAAAAGDEIDATLFNSLDGSA